MPAATTTQIKVFKGTGTRYHSKLSRGDGVTVHLEGGSWNKIGGHPGRVPHDIAHLVVEDEFGLPRGLWGVLATGGMVQNAQVTDGRLGPRAARQARTVTG